VEGELKRKCQKIWIKLKRRNSFFHLDWKGRPVWKEGMRGFGPWGGVEGGIKKVVHNKEIQKEGNPKSKKIQTKWIMVVEKASGSGTVAKGSRIKVSRHEVGQVTEGETKNKRNGAETQKSEIARENIRRL